MLKFTIKTSIHSPLHVSVLSDHLQGVYVDPFYILSNCAFVGECNFSIMKMHGTTIKIKK
jgi:hypothetical protein